MYLHTLCITEDAVVASNRSTHQPRMTNFRAYRNYWDGVGERARRLWFGKHGSKAARRVQAADLAHRFRKPLWNTAALPIFNPCVIPLEIQIPGEGHLIGLARLKCPPLAKNSWALVLAVYKDCI